MKQANEMLKTNSIKKIKKTLKTNKQVKYIISQSEHHHLEHSGSLDRPSR